MGVFVFDGRERGRGLWDSFRKVECWVWLFSRIGL